MKSEIKVPPMGESISEATIGTIIKSSGSKVNIDDEILELETDKVNQVIYAKESGVLTLTVVSEQTVKINEVIGYIDTEVTSAKEPKEKPKDSQPEVEDKKEIKKEEPQPISSKPDSSTDTASAPSKKPLEPSARFGQAEFIADLNVQERPKTVPPASEKTPSTEKTKKVEPTGRETRKKMSKIRRIIASRLVEAQHTAAMLTTFNEIDLSQVMLLREKYKEAFQKKHGAKLGFMSFFVKACVAALEAVPSINSYIDGDEIVHREYYDLGIAVGTDRGLVVPVVRNCDQLSYGEIEKSIENYAKKAREGGLTVDDLQGGGFTITNGGTYGSLLSTPILNPPQCGILGMHKISKRAIVVDDQIVIRPMMYVALSYDHRLVDGKDAVTFLVHVKNDLEDPARFLLEV